jgi:putative FmdB family regulatory protein
MPLYEYRCNACGQRFEVIQKFSDPPAETCTKCGKGPVERLLSSPAIQFKGSGWYITDYARKSSDASGGSKPASSSDDKKTDGSKSESTSTDSTKSTTAPATSTKE